VNLSTIRPGVFHDDTCVVVPGEHPFIQVPSYVVYRSAQVQAAERLVKLVAGWVYKPHAPASVELTDRMLAGVGNSRFTPKFVRTYLGL
jgi:hypothetical protein